MRYREWSKTEDDISVYIRWAKKIPLLTREEEAQLARAIKSGHPDALDMRRRFLEANLRLVVKIAQTHLKKASNTLPFPDLIQEGNIGLMRALDSFDPEMGFKFSTYASWWIRQAIIRARANLGKTIRIPVNQIMEQNRVGDAIGRLTTKLGRRPTTREIADFYGWKLKEVEKILRFPSVSSSLDSPASPDNQDSSPLSEIYEDEGAVNPEDRVVMDNLNFRTAHLLKAFPERDAEMFHLRFIEDKSLEEIGKQFDISRERVRQIIVKITRYLKNHFNQLDLHARDREDSDMAQADGAQPREE